MTLTGSVRLDTDAATTDANILVTGAVVGTAANNLTLVSGLGATTVTGTVGAGGQIATLTLQTNDAGATGTVTFNGAVTATALTTFAQAYAALLNAGGTITNAVTFNNTGGVTLGDNSGDTSTFNGGVTSTASTTTTGGTIATSDDAITLGAVTLAAATTLDTNAATAAGDITLGAVTGGGTNLTLETATVAGADITLNGSVAVGAASVVSANNVTSAVSLSASSFSQSAGLGTTSFGGTGLSSSVVAITTETISGKITGGSAIVAGAVTLTAGTINPTIVIGSTSTKSTTQFGVVTVTGSANFPTGSTIFGESGAQAAAAILPGGSCIFNAISCTDNSAASFENLVSGQFIQDLASLNINVDVNIGGLETTPAQVAFCTDVTQCGINPDVFGTDFGLLDAGGGSGDAYQAMPYVGGDFWKEFLGEEEDEEQ